MTQILSSHSFRLQRGGAHLLSAQTAAGELLFLSPKTGYYPQAPVRGGIPLIAPRFATMLQDKQPEEPKHGSARRLMWQLEQTNGGIRGKLLHADIQYELSYSFTSEGMQGTLSAHNTASVAQWVQLGFHPYFAVSDVREVELTGAGGLVATSTLDGSTTTLPETVRLTGLTDLMIAGASRMAITDPNRTITVEGTGDHMVLWNPWAHDAAGMEDLGEENWHRFICVEPALLGSERDGVLLEPKDTATVGITATVQAH